MTRVPLLLFSACALAAAPSWRAIGPGGGGTLFHPTISPHDSRTALVTCDMTGSYITHDAGAHWRMLNLGGSARYFVFDPSDERVIYIQADVLLRTADGGATWTRIFPRQIASATMGDDHASVRIRNAAGEPPGSATALAVDPEDSRILYMSASNILWTSYDTGGNWQNSATLPGRATDIWIDRHSPRGDRTLYVAGPDALYIRKDARWHNTPLPGKIDGIAAALPYIYVTIAGKIRVSTDAAATWRDSGLPGFGGTASAIANSAGHPQTAYVTVTGVRTGLRTVSGVAKTTDAGRHWEMVYENVRDAWLSERFGAGWAGAPIGLGVGPQDAGLVYATDSGRVMRTTDGGKLWSPAYSTPTPDGNWTTNGIDVTTCYGVHFDPFDPRHIFISYTDIGLWASDNQGASWYSATRNGVPREWENTTYWMEFDPTVRGRMWAAMSGTHDLPRAKMWNNRSPGAYTGGVVRSDDGGHTWRVQNNGMPQTAATHILRDPSGALYVTGFGKGVFKSTDGGEHWALKNAGIAGDQPFAWRIVRDSKGALYLIVARRSDDGSTGNSGDGAIYRSTDGAEHWSRLALPTGLNGPNGLAIDPRDPDRLYLAAWGRSLHDGAADGGIYLSTNRGTTWRRVLSQDQHIYDVTVDKQDPRLLYAAGFESAAWRSTDRGLTWKRIPGFDFRWGHRVIVDPQDHARIYITTFGGSVWTGTP
jgi:photosystem II stability/assembly factor-like uncharacterized protein